MDGDLVNVLMWTKPLKSGMALTSLNLSLWFMIRQRPVCVLSLLCLAYYLKYVWKHRIRPEVLVDPPDTENWVTISTYDFQHAAFQSLKRGWAYYVNLRTTSHPAWCVVSVLLWVVVGKIGAQVSLLTLLFIISNGSFLLGPLLNYLPTSSLTDDLLPDIEETDLWSPSEKEESPGPESLSPFLPRMPDHDGGDSEEEFQFDAKHFESGSSTSSTSTSFELINI